MALISLKPVTNLLVCHVFALIHTKMAMPIRIRLKTVKWPQMSFMCDFWRVLSECEKVRNTHGSETSPFVGDVSIRANLVPLCKCGKAVRNEIQFCQIC